ncbi:MAG: lactate racemase domain-containing protein [Desulfobacterales bacterium]
MDHSIELRYGAQIIPLSLSEQADIFQIREPDQKITPSLFSSRLEAGLQRMRPDLSDVSIVVGDKTRLCGYPEYLPVLVKTLEDFGVRRNRLTVFIAYGTHARQSDDECRAAYGDVYENLRFIHHDCTDDRCFSNVGKTAGGTRVRIRKDILDTTFLVTFGAISHHYFAGYGGGRKLVFPGLGHRESIYHNHGLFLDRDRRTLSLHCRSGVLDRNPLAEDLAEFETFRPADLAVHGILDSKGRVCDLMPGSGTGHFRNACAMHGKNCEIATDREYGLVIASGGGFPKDINFIQSHKAIENASKFVRDNGTLIVLAQCADGIGSSTFLPWFGMGGWETAFDKLATNYEGNGGTALSMMAKSQRIRILMVTDLDEKRCRTIGVEKISVDQAKTFINGSAGPLAAIPNAGMLVKISVETR